MKKISRVFQVLLLLTLLCVYASRAFAAADPDRPSLSEDSTVQVGLVIIMLGLAFGIGKNWTDVSRHCSDTNIHKTDSQMSIYLTKESHEKICEHTQAALTASKESQDKTAESLEHLTRAIIAAIPDIKL